MSDVRATATTVVRRTRRLLRPPLTGDGLLLVGFVEGLVGWPLSWVVVTQGVAPFGPLTTVVVLWGVLTAAIVAVGWFATAPTVRRNDVWTVWGVLILIATGANVLGVVHLSGVAETLPEALLQYAFFHPWLAAFGGGYLVTALLSREDRRLGRAERVGYGLAGVASLLVLAFAFSSRANSALTVQYVFHVGAVLYLAPIGFDLAYDTLR